MTITWQKLFSCLKICAEKDDSGYITYLRDRYFAETWTCASEAKAVCQLYQNPEFHPLPPALKTLGLRTRKP